MVQSAPHVGAGDNPATLAALYDAHGELCYRLAHRLVGETQLATSIVHDVFLASWKGAAAFDPARGSVQTWLLGLTHRRAAEMIRRTRQNPSRVSTSGTGVGLTGLGTEQREIVELAYFGGHTQSEIAELTGVGLSTVKSRTLGALRQLRSDLEARTAAQGMTVEHSEAASTVEQVAVERDRVVEMRFPHLEPVVGQ